MQRSLRAVFHNEHGGGPVEYIAVTGIALVLASVLITGIVDQRYTIGATMGAHLNLLISSFQGGGGTIPDYDLQLEIGQPEIGQFEQPPAQEPAGASPPPRPIPPILRWPPPLPAGTLTIGTLAAGSVLALAFRQRGKL